MNESRWRAGLRCSGVLAALWLGAAVAMAAPVVTGFSPAYGGPGVVVAIAGAGFADATEVRFQTVPAAFAVKSAGSIWAVVPAEAVTGPLTVTTLTGSASSALEFVVAPRVVSFAPAYGGVGDTVQITGANFIAGGTAVRFGGVAATAVEVAAASQLQARVPVGALAGPIAVATWAGTGTSSTAFRVLGPGPFVAKFAPAEGGPGTQVVLEGVQFTGASAVKFNGVPAAFAVTADTQILTTVPADARTGPISVTGPQGAGFSDTHFLVTGLGPRVASFAPSRGIAGAQVTIEGAHFTAATLVQFGGAAARFEVTADTQIQATVPTNATTGPIAVGTPWGTNASATAFIVGRPPRVTSFAPDRGQPGREVIVEGEGFTGTTAVKFGERTASFAVLADTQLRTYVPVGATNGPIRVTNPDGTGSSTNAFIVLGSGPVVTGFAPDQGPPGTVVVIDGLGLNQVAAVWFGTAAAGFEVASDTQLRATVPTNATTGPILLHSSWVTNASSGVFHVPPRLASFAPVMGIPGDAITLRGANLAEVTAVRFHGTPASFSVVSAAELVATVPMHAASGPLTVSSPYGDGLSTNAFVVQPGIVSFSPSAGPPGTVVTIVGSGFAGASSVRFGLATAVFTVDSPSQLRAVVPPNALTGPIVVTTPQGAVQSATSFIVAASADLAVGQEASPGPWLPENPAVYTLRVTNLGPSAASGVVLTHRLPTDADFRDAQASQGQVTRTGAEIVFAFGALGVGGVATGTVTVLPHAVGLWTNALVAAHGGFDPEPTNNLGTLLVAVRTPFDVNLVRNGDAESGVAGSARTNLVSLPAWSVTNALTVLPYGLGAGLPTLSSPGPGERGRQLFVGGPSQTASTATQVVNVVAGTAALETGGTTFELSGWLGGTTDESDAASFTARFLSLSNAVLGQATIGPVLPGERTNTTGLLFRQTQGRVPQDTRAVEFVLEMRRVSGPGNDGFADNLGFVLRAPPPVQLTLGRVTNAFRLAWPAVFTNFVLESSAQVPAAATAWLEVPGTPTLAGEELRLVVTNRAPAAFYRLRRR